MDDPVHVSVPLAVIEARLRRLGARPTWHRRRAELRCAAWRVVHRATKALDRWVAGRHHAAWAAMPSDRNRDRP
jgi:hypothetical protein